MTSDQELFAQGMEYYDDVDYWKALPLLKQVADKGDKLAAEKVANCYNRTGDPDSAVHYWEICRVAGNHSANTNYASYLKDVANQPDLAMQLWQEASDAGIPQAAFNLGVWLKNLGKVEEAKTLLKRAGDLGYLDGYFVLAGIYYYASQWAQAREALIPFKTLEDERVEKLLLAIDMKEKEENAEADEEFDWNEYAWDWKTPLDVREFVDLVLKHHNSYDYAYDTLSGIGDENFYFQWWRPVQEAIKDMAKSFNREHLEEAIEYLLAPEGDFVECDPAIFDALLKYVPGFPSAFPKFAEGIETFLDPREYDYTSDWWDFTWYPFLSADFTWTFWGPETMARSTNIAPEYLTAIFRLSFIAATPYKSFRARVALASNPNSPKEILEFLFENRESNDWLINDRDEEGAFSIQDGKYVIDEDLETIETLREDAELVESFSFSTDDSWSSGPGAEYVENLLDIEWEADSARTCLLAAFAKNPGLESAQYEELAESEHPLVRYFLSLNPSIPADLKERLSAENPTFTYKPYGARQSLTEDVTLGITTFVYRDEDRNRKDFIGIFCAICDNEIGYEPCPVCEDESA